MRFFSDNDAPVHPAVLAAIEAANASDAAYDGDALSQALDARFSALFERDVAVIWMPSGTAANALALSLLCPPYGGIVAHEEAHIVLDECGAVELQTGGARLLTCAGEGARLSVDSLRERVANMASSIGPTRSRRSATSAARRALRCTWMAPASPMRWRRWAARRRT